jgi:hypothetical protein
MDYNKNNMSTDGENGRENIRARVTRESRNPKYGKRKHYIVHKPIRERWKQLVVKKRKIRRGKSAYPYSFSTRHC